MNKKRYGDTKTALDGKLSKIAQMVYQSIDPISIYEYETEEGLRYDIEGFDKIDEQTAEQVNKILESWDVAWSDDLGGQIDFDLAVSLMDDEIREEIHDQLAPCLKKEFFDAYCEAHEEKYGEPFMLP